MVKEKLLGYPDYKVTQRLPVIKVLIDKWDFNTGRIKDTIDITSDNILSYSWSKSLLNPASSGQVSFLPQFLDKHLLEDLSPMDVVRIYEFDTLKYVGYIVKIGASGSIGKDGKPNRSVGITLRGFGGYLIDSVVGVNLAIFKEDFPILEASIDLMQKIHDAADKNFTFRKIISEIIIPEWFIYLNALIDSNVQKTYIETYVDFTDGISTKKLAGFPKEPQLFYGVEDTVGLWSILEKLMEAPLNEFFFDEGPRNVHIDGKNIRLAKDKTYMIGRPTPFDGTVESGKTIDRFKLMKPVVIPKNHFLQYDLNKSMEEIYTLYVTAPAMFDMSEMQLIAMGEAVKDNDRLRKYLYKLCNKPLYYLKMTDSSSTKAINEKPVINDRAKEVTQTYYNWFSKNDIYLSGTLRMMVPNNEENEPRIGDRVDIEGIPGSFYVETSNRNWSYGGTLTTTLGVSRGYDYILNTKMSLRDKLFKKGIYA